MPNLRQSSELATYQTESEDPEKKEVKVSVSGNFPGLFHLKLKIKAKTIKKINFFLKT